MSLVGRRIGHILIEERLGVGGMGEVYRGFDETLQREVAVKTLLAERRLATETKARFLREARILSRLDHPRICRIHDLISEEDADFLILEYISGKTLGAIADELQDQNHLLRLMIQILDALAAAHAEGIVHRDLKPDNIMVAEDGQTKILDFGIARSLEQAVVVERPDETSITVRQAARLADPEAVLAEHDIDQSVTAEAHTRDIEQAEAGASDFAASTELATLQTRQGLILGTVRYMSPEQAASDTVTAASDMYSLGVILHELLSGGKAYGDVQGVTLLLKVYRADTVPVHGLDPELTRLIEELENVDPDARPTAEQTRNRLQWILDRPHRARRRKLRTVTAAAVAAVLLTAAGVAIISRVQAGRRAAVAHRFTAAAKDMEWQLRAEHMSPAHNVRPVMEQIRERMVDLEAQMASLGDTATGSGNHALGCTHLGLGELDDAREHLELAWASGYHEPEVAYNLGLVLGRLYQRELWRVHNISDTELRATELEYIEQQLRDPALDFLDRGRESTTVFPAYVEGLIHLYEGRYEDALTAAQDLGSAAPWFYEGLVLQGLVHESLATRAGLDHNDNETSVAEYEAAAEIYGRASAVAESDPEVWLTLCRAEVGRYHTLERIFTSDDLSALGEAAMDACNRVLELDPQSARAWAELAKAVSARGSIRSRRGEDPTDDFNLAVDYANRGLEIDPHNLWALAMRAWARYQQGWHELINGKDARTSYDLAIRDFARLCDAPATLAVARLNHADALYGRACCELMDAKDPTVYLERGIAVAEEGLRMSPASSSLLTGLGNLSCILGRHQAAHGLDPLAAFQRSIDSYTTGSERSSNPETFRNLALVQTDLADHLVAIGSDPGPVIEDALANCDRAIALNPDYGYPQYVKGVAHMSLSRADQLAGKDPTSQLDQAYEWFEIASKQVKNFSQAHLMMAVIELERATMALEAGRDPGPDASSARKSLQQLLRFDPESLDADRMHGQLLLLEARWKIRRGLDAGTALGRALDLVTIGCEKAPGATENRLAVADVHLWRGRWQAGRGQSAEAEINHGLDAVAAILEINPREARTEALRARLLHLRSETNNDPALASEARSEARAARDRALEINPLLVNQLDDLSR